MFAAVQSRYKKQIIEGLLKRNKIEKMNHKPLHNVGNFNLTMHIRRVHEGKPLNKEKCIYCDEEVMEWTMDYHIRTYHGDKLLPENKLLS